MSTHSGSIWTVRCASNSTSPSCGQSHGPIASSVPLRAAALLLAWECIRSRGAVTLVHAHHVENSPVESPDTDSQTTLGLTFHQSVLAQKTILTNCWRAWRRHVTLATGTVSDMITRKGQKKLVDASPALSQTSMQTCVHVSNSGRQHSMRKHQRAHLHRRLSGKSRPTRATGPGSGNNLHNLLARRPFFFLLHSRASDKALSVIEV